MSSVFSEAAGASFSSGTLLRCLLATEARKASFEEGEKVKRFLGPRREDWMLSCSRRALRALANVSGANS